MDRDPAKARAWEQRSRARALERQRSKPRAPLPRGARIEQRSSKPKAVARRADIAAACREAIERDGRRCQAPPLIPGHVCWGPLDPQHVIPQGIRKDLAAEPANIVAICRGAHEWVEANKRAARLLGLHGHDGDDLEELARRRRGLAPNL